MRRIAELIDAALQTGGDETMAQRVRGEVRELTNAFPLYLATEAGAQV